MAVLEVNLHLFVVFMRVETFVKLSWFLMLIAIGTHPGDVIIDHYVPTSLQSQDVMVVLMIYFIPALLIHALVLKCQFRFIENEFLIQVL